MIFNLSADQIIKLICSFDVDTFIYGNDYISVSYTHLDVYKRQLQHEKEKLEKLLIAEKANLEEKIALFFKEFSNGALAFFSQSLVRRTSEFLKEVKVDDKGVVDLTAPTILELLRRGRCICAVSYTHLDVYKRQPQARLISFAFF